MPLEKSCPVLLTGQASQQNRTQRCFAGQSGWKECALRCAVIVRSPVRAPRRRGALPLAAGGTLRRAAPASSTRGRAYA